MRLGGSSVGKRLPDMPRSSRGRIGALGGGDSTRASTTDPIACSSTNGAASFATTFTAATAEQHSCLSRGLCVCAGISSIAPQRRPLSPALVAAATAVGICALLAVLYLFVLPRKTSAPASTSLESPSGALASPPAHAHPLAKYIEIAGLRVMEDRRGLVKVGYVVVNHSPADLPELRAQITFSAAGKPVFEFPTTIPSIGPYESKDLTATLKTNLRPYELPDWQALKPAFVIRSEQ